MGVQIGGGGVLYYGGTGGKSVDLDGSRLVSLAKVEDRIEADAIISLLRERRIGATWRVPQSPPLDGLEAAWMGNRYGEILVLDVDLGRARELLDRYERGMEG